MATGADAPCVLVAAGGTGGPAVHRLEAPLARPTRLRECSGPRAVELQELGADELEWLETGQGRAS